MAFTNISIDPASLPQSGSVPLRPIHPAYLKVLRIVWFILFTLLLVVISLLFYFNQDWLQLVVLVPVISAYLLLLAFTVVVGTGSFKRKAYAIREKDIMYQTGWIFRKLHIVPYSRLQHCVLKTGPIERRFGLASIGLFTAASEVRDIRLHGLPQAEAEQLREWILQQIQPMQASEEI